MRLRVLDFGIQAPLQSQAIYHGLAAALRPQDDAILALATPAAPYISIGLHQDLSLEIDDAYCREAGLPIVRRQTGGGAVYLDADQLFFQFIFPFKNAPRVVREMYPFFAEPVVRAYRALGIPAALRPLNDIAVRGRKIGGTAAASIGHATVFVGSFLFDFNAVVMARCVRASDRFRARFAQAMNEYVTTIARESHRPAARAAFQRALIAQASEVFGAKTVVDQPRADEMAAIEEAARELADPEWLHLPGRKHVAHGVKIAAGTFLAEVCTRFSAGTVQVQLLNRDGRIADLALGGDYAGLAPAVWTRLAQRLVGTALAPTALRARIEAGLGEVKGAGLGYAEDMTRAILRGADRD